MGFLSFLSSKKSSDRHPTGIRTQAYHATAASLPPLRGTYPVAGNGPANVFEDLQRSHNYKMSQSTLSLTAGSDASAPPPPVSRLRDSIVERPRTAPNGAGPMPRPYTTAGHGGRESMRGPPLSFRKPKVESFSSASPNSHQFAAPPQRQSEISPVVTLQPPSAPFMQHNRHTSMQSMNSTKGFVDILDAQSEFKPLNFQSRVKAAGTRDYGEDVADRNIGENGVDLESPQVQAFYATSSGGKYSEPNQSAPAPAISRTTYGDASELFKPSRRNDLYDLTSRTHSLNSATFKPFPQRTSSFSPRDLINRPFTAQTPHFESNQAMSDRASRRQSVGSFIPFAPASYAPRSRSRPTSAHRSSIRAAEGPNINQQRRPSTSYERTGNELGIYTHSVPKVAPAKPPTSPKLPRDSVMLAKKNYPSPISRKGPSNSDQVSHEMRNSTYTSPAPTKRHSMSSVTGESSRHNDWSRNSKQEGIYDTRGWVGRVDVESSAHANLFSPAPSPHVSRAGHSRNDSGGESQGLYQRTRSLASMSGKSKLNEIYEYIPMRTSSLRHMSISSATPTMSSTSSNPFARPQSRHTANTSVDMATLSSLMTSSHSSLNSGVGGLTHSNCTALESRLQSPLTPATSATGLFNIDDYLSSDDDIDADSFIAPPRKKSGTEQELLFRDTGYGMRGLQLPGLFDSIPDAPAGAPQVVRHLRHSYSSPSRITKRLSLESRIPATPYDMEDEEDDFDEDEYIILRADLIPGRRNAKRLSALGTMYQRIEEENNEKIDVRTAIRMRKEAKSKKRAMSRSDKGRKTEVDIDEANHADVE